MKILIAIDDQYSVDSILRFVKRHNWRSPAEFRVIHVVSPVMVDHPMGSYPLFLESVQQDIEHEGHKLLQSVKHGLTAVTGAEVSCDLLIGYPAATIVAAASDWQCDALILGSHCRHGFDRLFMGSVSSEVAKNAPCSVIVVPVYTNPTEENAATDAKRVAV